MEVGADWNFAIIAKFEIQRPLDFQGTFQLLKLFYKKGEKGGGGGGGGTSFPFTFPP